MSIASKEAEDIYPVTNDGLSVESIIMDNDDAILQKAYIAGRTAEPTDTEIEAGAFGIFKVNVNMGKLNPTDDDYRDLFSHTPDMVLYAYRRQAKSALIEARKAVRE